MITNPSPTNINVALDKTYPWAKDLDEARRTFVFELMIDPEHDPKIAIANMDTMIAWLKNGSPQEIKKEPTANPLRSIKT